MAATTTSLAWANVVLYLALSAFQARTQDNAWEALIPHAPDGIQLTPGNLPSPGFADRVRRSGVRTRLHHGFAHDRYRQPVYDSDLVPRLRERHRSIHPPASAEHALPTRRRVPPAGPTTSTRPRVIGADWLRGVRTHDPLLETMYPGYVLGVGAELDLAMDLGFRLAVDISHLHIQRKVGALADHILRRLLVYPSIEEIHVSHNDGSRDQHSALRADTPWLDWAVERGRGLPVVLESYWHRSSLDERKHQLDLLADCRAGTPRRAVTP